MTGTYPVHVYRAELTLGKVVVYSTPVTVTMRQVRAATRHPALAGKKVAPLADVVFTEQEAIDRLRDFWQRRLDQDYAAVTSAERNLAIIDATGATS